jgi:signal transduction histidine kinase
MATILSLQECVVSSTDASKADYLPSIAQKILEPLSSCLRIESLSLLLYDGPTQSLSLFAMTGVGTINLGQEQHVSGKYLTGIAFQSNKTQCSNNLGEDPLADKEQVARWSKLLPSRKLANALFVPFRSALECCGVFRAFNKLDVDGSLDAEGFSTEEVAFVESIARMTGHVFGTAWEKRAFSYLTREFYTIPGKEDVRDMCGAVANAAAVVANSAASALYLVDAAEQDYLRLAGSWGFSRPFPSLSRFPIHGSIAGRVAREAQSVEILDLASTPGVANRDVALSENLSSCAAVPVRGTTVRGCLATFTRDRRTFQKTTINVLESLGLYAGSLLQASTAAIQAENLRQVLQLVGHSLRSPLAAINQVSDELLYELSSGVQEKKKMTQLVESIQGYKDLAVGRFETLLYAKRNILDVMGIERKPVDISKLLEECVKRHRLDASTRGINIVIKGSARKLPDVRCDLGKIDLVFDNLLENAIKYSWKNEAVEISGWYSEKEVRIAVADKGLGIPSKNYTKIFEAFGRSDILDATRYIKGTGLGLQLAKIIIEAHQGKIEVVSTPFLSDRRRLEMMDGFDTVFTVTIPR